MSLSRRDNVDWVRRYCTNTLTPELRKHLEEFLAEIARLQRRMYGRDSVKGKSKRRYYAGIKEVQKHIDLKKIKFVVIAPDLEKVEMEGTRQWENRVGPLQRV